MKNFKLWSSIITAGLIFTACGNSNSSPTTFTYTITMKNLSYTQPMSPMAVVYHNNNKNVFKIGEKATVALEKLSESGDNSAVLAQFTSTQSQGGNGLILPSKSDTVTIESSSKDCISIASMLVNTNDAFVGANCIDVRNLKRDESLSLKLTAYDAGTEKNSELASTIPGPAGGGEGVNSQRNDINFVHIHANVITKDDGLLTSTLTQAHKWNNPVATLIIKRIN